MRIGIDQYTIANRNLSAAGTLDFAASRGLEGVQFLEPRSLSSKLDRRELEGLARRARELNLYIEVGIPSPNPVRRSRELGRGVGAAEHADWLRPHLNAVAEIGCRAIRAYVGDRHDRFRRDVVWGVQREATEEVLKRLSGELRDLGLKIALETHADLRVDELLTTIDRVGDAVLGVTLDTGNLAMRLDDPLVSVGRLAPLVLLTHVKDVALAFSERGLRWQARPVGGGILPMAELLETLARANPSINLSIELHPRTYDLPIFDRSWLACFSDLDPGDLAAVVELAHACEKRYESGVMERQEVVEAVAWADRDLDWLERSTRWLRAWRDSRNSARKGPSAPIGSAAGDGSDKFPMGSRPGTPAFSVSLPHGRT